MALDFLFTLRSKTEISGEKEWQLKLQLDDINTVYIGMGWG